MLKDLLYFYNQGILKILGFTLLIVLPWQLFLFGLIYYIYQIDLIAQNLFALFLYVFMFIATQKPFIHLYKQLKLNEEYGIRQMLRDFITSFGVIFVGALVLFVLSYFGTGFYIIPGVIILTFVFLLPYYQENQASLKKTVANGLSFYKNNWFSIYTDLLLWVSIDVIIWVIFLNSFSSFDINLLTYTLLRIVINLFLFPFIYFYLSEKYEQNT
ncbi:hypothetical protein [Bacillus sp. B15-48]|uniref:hypothetical protein n=1 Tax=Bacillus sp. B15-48 TaxID=1548601 RepID=UPI00193FED83|nr:hypothetical protein [Bacillus sp. B15-48]MBM4763251.1 hypothetical protein [Bacillus sp. B15-48]